MSKSKKNESKRIANESERLAIDLAKHASSLTGTMSNASIRDLFRACFLLAPENEEVQRLTFEFTRKVSGARYDAYEAAVALLVTSWDLALKDFNISLAEQKHDIKLREYEYDTLKAIALSRIGMKPSLWREDSYESIKSTLGMAKSSLKLDTKCKHYLILMDFVDEEIKRHKDKQGPYQEPTLAI